MLPALVLTAGLATRLRPLSLVRAKAALPVAGEPLVRRILRYLGEAGVTDAVLNLHHLPDTLTGLIGDGSDLGMQVRYSWEPRVLGSAGGPRRALPLLAGASDAFIAINGDTLTDVDLRAVVADHRASGALVTMALVPNREPQKYSGVAVADDGAVTGFVKRGSGEPSYHFFGVQVISMAALEGVSPDEPSETVNALYPALIDRRRGNVRAFRCEANYLDIGTPSDYLDTCLRLGSADPRTLIGARAEVAQDARVERSVLWDDVAVGAGSRLRECVVTDGVRVPADTSWHGVSIRRAGGELAAGERMIDGLAIAALS